ncbi:hypothetical protein BJ742DRAFT_778669 [Cladochytrium replicatum]|nr:hypothetical protein BJ742DRAFT_778669 [Cladochytrium replicatum]
MDSVCWDNPFSEECPALQTPYVVVVLTYTALFLLPSLIRYGRWNKAHFPKHHQPGYLPFSLEDDSHALIAAVKVKINLYIGAPLFAALGVLFAGSALFRLIPLVATSVVIYFEVASISFYLATTQTVTEPAVLFEHDKRERRNLLLALAFNFLITIPVQVLFLINSALAKAGAESLN